METILASLMLLMPAFGALAQGSGPQPAASSQFPVINASPWPSDSEPFSALAGQTIQVVATDEVDLDSGTDLVANDGSQPISLRSYDPCYALRDDSGQPESPIFNDSCLVQIPSGETSIPEGTTLTFRIPKKLPNAYRLCPAAPGSPAFTVENYVLFPAAGPKSYALNLVCFGIYGGQGPHLAGEVDDPDANEITIGAVRNILNTLNGDVFNLSFSP